MIQDKKILLYGKTTTDYKDITLAAPKVELDQQTQIVTAFNKKTATERLQKCVRDNLGSFILTIRSRRYPQHKKHKTWDGMLF